MSVKMHVRSLLIAMCFAAQAEGWAATGALSLRPIIPLRIPSNAERPVTARVPSLRMSASAAGCRNFYTVLGVSPSATKFEIKRAFRQVAKRCHPDTMRGCDEGAENFMLATEAYETLVDPSRRGEYDVKNGIFECALERLFEQQQHTGSTSFDVESPEPKLRKHRNKDTQLEAQTDMFELMVQLQSLAEEEVLGQPVVEAEKKRQSEDDSVNLAQDLFSQLRFHSAKMTKKVQDTMASALQLTEEVCKGVPSSGRGCCQWKRIKSVCMVHSSFGSYQSCQTPLCGSIAQRDCQSCLELEYEFRNLV